MRWLLLASVIGCTQPPVRTTPTPRTAPNPPPEPFWDKREPEPEPGPLVTLATARTLYILATEDFGHECRAWRIEQSKAQDDDTAYLVDDEIGGAERIGFVNHGARLELVSRTRIEDSSSRSTPCSGTFSVSERDDGGLDVSGARWFANRDDCQRALDTHARVATDLSTCAWPAVANLQQQAAAQRRFEAILRFGGAVFGIAGDACKTVRVEAARTNTARTFHGQLWNDLRDGARRGKSGYGYMMTAHAMTIALLGPHSSWSDGSGFGMLCGDTHAITYGVDTATLAEPLYLTAASCRVALAKERKRLSRLPGAEHDAHEISSSATPHLGGC